MTQTTERQVDFNKFGQKKRKIREWKLVDVFSQMPVAEAQLHTVLAPVVYMVDWVNLYPLDSAIVFSNTYPLDSDLYCGQRYPATFEKLELKLAIRTK